MVSAILCVFFLFPLKGRYDALLYPATDMSRGSLINSIGSVVDLLVTLWWSGREITGESLQNLKMVIDHNVI